MYNAGGFEQIQHVVLSASSFFFFSASSFCTSVVLWFKLCGNFPKTLRVTTVKGGKVSLQLVFNQCVCAHVCFCTCARVPEV